MQWAPLTILESKVREFAERCLPDVRCTGSDDVGKLLFEDADVDELIGCGPSGPSAVVLQIDGKPYLWTDWSRHQLLSHLGTKEKWFESVSLQEQSIELNRRIHTFAKHRLRIMDSCEPNVGILRGLVSSVYAEISDTDIMKAIIAVTPEGSYVENLSGKTDRALYAYVMSEDTPLRIEDQLLGHPGVLLKNSEVGYTSLWVIPFLMVRCGITHHPVIFREKCVLRRTHRGSVEDLRVAFSTALRNVSALWAPLQKQLDKLLETTFPDEDAAAARLESLLRSLGTTQGFIRSCVDTYRRTPHASHTAKDLFDAVLANGQGANLDEDYLKAEVAGALLLKLL